MAVVWTVPGVKCWGDHRRLMAWCMCVAMLATSISGRQQVPRGGAMPIACLIFNERNVGWEGVTATAVVRVLSTRATVITCAILCIPHLSPRGMKPDTAPHRTTTVFAKKGLVRCT